MPESMCSKCGERPRADADSNNPWCRECRAEYQREYTAKRQEREKSKGFSAGVEAMRNHLAGQFRRLGNVTVSAIEAATWVQNAAPPKD